MKVNRFPWREIVTSKKWLPIYQSQFEILKLISVIIESSFRKRKCFGYLRTKVYQLFSKERTEKKREEKEFYCSLAYSSTEKFNYNLLNILKGTQFSCWYNQVKRHQHQAYWLVNYVIIVFNIIIKVNIDAKNEVTFF